MSNEKILIVDDDEMLLKSISRIHSDDFDITTALGPHKALELVESEGPFALVVADMKMPEMNGIDLLSRIESIHPDTVRMMLSGYAELNTTIAAINKGHIFRFLTKPCDDDDFASALRSGLKQYSLVESEKELLEGTLQSSVKVLSEVLSLVRPLAFGKAERIRSTVDGMLKRIEIQDSWQLEIAAMLCSLGCVTIPEDLLQRHFDGETLSHEERQILEEHPILASKLVGEIPRLNEVARLIGCQPTRLDRKISVSDFPDKNSQILLLSMAFEHEERDSESSLHSMTAIREKYSALDDDVMDAFVDFVKKEKNQIIREVVPDELCEGMVLAQDLINENGTLLMSKGQKITAAALRLVENSSMGGKAFKLKIVDVQGSPVLA